MMMFLFSLALSLTSVIQKHSFNKVIGALWGSQAAPSPRPDTRSHVYFPRVLPTLKNFAVKSSGPL